MKLFTALIIGTLLSTSAVFAEEKLPVSLNVGLSAFNASGLGANIEVPLSSNISVSAGTGHYGGYSGGAKLYRNITNDGWYLGAGYGVVEFEETYVSESSSWEENLEYGTFFLAGYRFVNNSGNFFNVGFGVFQRPEEEDEHLPGETEGGYNGFTFDLTYGFVF